MEKMEKLTLNSQKMPLIDLPKNLTRIELMSYLKTNS